MDIKYKDIDAISYALCYAGAMLDITIEDLEKKGFNDIANTYKLKKRRAKEGNGFASKDKERTASKR